MIKPCTYIVLQSRKSKLTLRFLLNNQKLQLYFFFLSIFIFVNRNFGILSKRRTTARVIWRIPAFMVEENHTCHSRRYFSHELTPWFTRTYHLREHVIYATHIIWKEFYVNKLKSVIPRNTVKMKKKMFLSVRLLSIWVLNKFSRQYLNK